VVKVVKVLRAMRDPASRILPPALLPYLDQRILASSWYPEQDCLGLLAALVQIGQARGITWELFGALAAQTDLTGVYRSVVVKGDVAATLARARVAWRNYHDSGDIHTELTDGASVKMEIVDYPIVSAEMCRLHGAFLSEFVTASGVRITGTQKTACTARRDRSCIWLMDYVPSG